MGGQKAENFLVINGEFFGHGGCIFGRFGGLFVAPEGGFSSGRAKS